MKILAFLIVLLFPSFASAKFIQKEVAYFVKNNGQITDQNLMHRSDVKYSYHFENNSLFFKTDGVSYQFNSRNDSKIISYRVDIDFIGTNNIESIKTNKTSLTKLNYYNNINGKLIEAKTFEELIYKNLYNSINLKYYFKNGNLKYDFEVAPNADYKQIKIKIKGANRTFINNTGDLVIVTPFGNIVENKPIVFQNNQSLKASWILENNVVSFKIENVNPKFKLIIDPLVRLWGTYNGGAGQDVIYYSKVDNLNNLYVSGYTNSTSNIATIGSFQNIFGGQSSQVWGDAFVAKYNSAGVRIWSTYYGGTGSDFGSMINIDASGNVFLVGATLSTNTIAIATPSAHQTNYGGGSNTGDAFIVKFNSSGLRLWGTYFGGTGDDYADGATLDNSGNLYLTGVTSSTISNVIASLGSFQQTYGGGSNDAFLAKFDSNGNRLWATYIGGNGIDNGLACNFDGFGNILIAGYTTSTNNITTLGAHQPIYGGGSTFGDGFLNKFDTNGNKLYGSYYGGSGEDYIGNIIANSSGEIFIAGSSSTNTGTNIASPGSYQFAYGGGTYDFFLAKFNSTLTRQWGTYYGGAGADEMGYCAVNNNGVFLSGRTTSPSQSVLTTSCSYQTAYGGGFSDACLSKFDFNGNRSWSSLYGASGTEDSPAVGCNLITNEIYLSGATSSNNSSLMTSAGAQQNIYGGGASDGFIVKFDDCFPTPPPNSTILSNLQVCPNNTTILTTSLNCGIYWYNVPTGGTPIHSGSSFTTNPIVSNTIFYIEETSCGTSTRTPVQVTVLAQPTLAVILTSTAICNGSSSTLSLSGANTFSLNNNSVGSITSVVLNPSITTIYTITGSNSSGCVNSIITTLSVSPCTSILDNKLKNSYDIQCYFINDYINLECAFFESNNFKVFISSSSGQLIFKEIISTNNYKIPFMNFSDGVYLILIKRDNEIVYKKKFMK